MSRVKDFVKQGPMLVLLCFFSAMLITNGVALLALLLALCQYVL